MSNFKARVLDSAVKEINEKTDIIVKYEQVKTGVKITGFKFSFKIKPVKKTKKAKKIIDKSSIDGLSDAQLARIARSEQFKRDYNHLISPTSPINNDYTGQAWINHFVKELKKDASKFSKRPIRDYLDY